MEKLVRRGGGGHFHGGGHSHSHGSGSHHYSGGHHGGEHSSGEHSSGHSDGEGNGKSKKSSDDEQENSSSFWWSHRSRSGSSSQRSCESIVDAKERENCINRSQNIGLFDIFIIFAGVILFIGSGFYKIIKKLS